MRIAYQGEPGAFSEEACARFAADAEAAPFPSFEAAVAAVQGGVCRRAMLPVENSLAGPVEGVLALLPGSGLKSLGRFELPIRMMLMALPGAEIHHLRSVASHPVALKQCRRVIAELALQELPAFDTAGAARLLVEEKDSSRAVLASRAAAERWGLTILRAEVQDRADNVTTFTLLEA